MSKQRIIRSLDEIAELIRVNNLPENKERILKTRNTPHKHSFEYPLTEADVWKTNDTQEIYKPLNKKKK